MSTPLTRFSAMERLLHWWMAACLIAMLFIGVGMVSTIDPKYLPLIAIHKTLGILLLGLALLRLGVRLRTGAPPLPADLPPSVKLAAFLSHYALYGIMLLMPLLGWAMLSAEGYPVILWGGVHLPAIVPADARLHTVLWNAHVYLAFAFYALVIAHLSAALYHALVRHDGVFTAMSPLPLRRSSDRAD